jgi:plastocyanin
MALSEKDAIAPSIGHGRLSWQKLLRASGIAGAAVMAIVAVTIGDLEAGAVALALGVSVALLAVRSGLLGKIGIGLVSIITFFFMLTAALTNVRAGSPTGAVLLSAGLASLFLIGVASAAMCLIRRNRELPSNGPWLPIGVSALLLIGLLGWSGLSTKGSAVTSDVSVVAENVAFTPTNLSASAGEVTVGLANKDLFWHTFTIEELGVDLLVPVGANLTVTFEASPGDYRFICRIPGHPDAGMEGILTITG